MVDMSYGSLAGFPLTSGSTPSTVTQMSSSASSVTSSRACCENGRPIMTDPHTGQTICSCQYGTALLNYSRVQGLPEGVYGASAAAYAAGAAQGYVPLGSPEGSAFYSPLANPGFDIKEGSEAWRALAAQSGGCFPYDPSMALYPYGSSYGGLDLNARRKNATRETTNTLKAWLYEHRKNPYPTKGEKIMLAIITKMTLTQVSTWFANARRRLKKENKMTWSPRNRSEDDASGDEDMDSTKGNDHESDGSTNLNISLDDSHEGNRSHNERDRLDRIISVDDDESDQSDLGDLDDLEHCKDDLINRGGENKENTDNRLERLDSRCNIAKMGQTSDVRENGLDAKSQGLSDSNESNSSNSGKSLNSTNISQGGNNSEGGPQVNRPKIWSVIDVLGKDKDKDNSTHSGSSSAQTSLPAVVCSRQTNGPSFLNQHFRTGQFPVGYGGYPLSLSHTTLSYPYTLSASTAAKADINMKQAHAAALRATEQAFKEGLTDKSVRMQGRIFSPARELDVLRVGGGKMVL